MRPTTLLSALLAAATTAAAATTLTIPVHLQAITVPSSPPILLAEITHTTKSDVETDDSPTEVTNYAAPLLPESARLVRIGAYDAKTKQWTSSVTVLSAENFGKGYSPHFVVSLDEAGEGVVGVACRGVKVDAGYTRDFGPQARVVVGAKGRQVEVNTPVVLSAEGKNVVVEEKTLLQKYVPVPRFELGLGLVLTLGQVLVGTGDWSVCGVVWGWGWEIGWRLRVYRYRSWVIRDLFSQRLRCGALAVTLLVRDGMCGLCLAHPHRDIKPQPGRCLPILQLCHESRDYSE